MAGTAIAALLILAGGRAHAGSAANPDGWPAYGGDQGGMRFSPARQITPANVTTLTTAWTYSTGAMTRHKHAVHRSAFEATPILAEGRLYVCSPFNAVSALDPGTGRQLWRYDPHIATKHVYYPNSFNCRGVAFWHSSKPGAVCANRIILNTNDLRLIALDAKTGKPCAGFGDHGTVRIVPEKAPGRKHDIQITSAPVVTDGTIIVGSSINDNQHVAGSAGHRQRLRCRDRRAQMAFRRAVGLTRHPRRGRQCLGADEHRCDTRAGVPADLLAQPGLLGRRPARRRHYADSVVALRIADGSVAWSFQVTHHDVWDYDVAAQPTLATITYKGKREDAVLVPTKQGLLFTLDRDTGKPIIPVVERKVPQDGAPGEKLSPTQPFPIAPKPLAKTTITPDEAYGLTFWDRGKCRAMIAKAKNEGIYTPPSTQGTIVFPFTGGGTNWGGLAFDPRTDTAYVNTSNAMHLITLIPARDVSGMQDKHPDDEISAQKGAPFGMERQTLLSPVGIPCNPPPWGQLHAVDMHTGKIRWSVPLGTTQDMVPYSQYLFGTIGVPNIGGPMVTAGGLVFIGATMDNYIRAFDAQSGKELWKGRLPAGGQATPMTYLWKGRQYVVIAAGGHEKFGTKRGDQLVAYALPPSSTP